MMRVFLACIVAFAISVGAGAAPAAAYPPSAQTLLNKSFAALLKSVHSVHALQTYTTIGMSGSSVETVSSNCLVTRNSLTSRYSDSIWNGDQTLSDSNPLPSLAGSRTDVVVRWVIGELPQTRLRVDRPAPRGVSTPWVRQTNDQFHPHRAQWFCPGSRFFLHLCQDTACTARSLNPLLASLTNLGGQILGTTPVWHLEGTLNDSPGATRVDYYLSSATLLPRKLAVSMPSGSVRVLSIYNYSAYNKPVTITIPKAVNP